MKDSTKRYLKIGGCVVGGLALLSVGQFWLSSTIGGVLIATGKVAPPAGATKEMFAGFAKTSKVVGDIVKSGACFAASGKMLREAGQEIHAAMKEPKVSIVAPPPMASRRFDEKLNSDVIEVS